MRMQDYIEDEKTQFWAYIVDKDEIVEYDEALSCDFYDSHPEVHEHCKSSHMKFLGIGYICNYDYRDNISCDTRPSRIYVWME